LIVFGSAIANADSGREAARAASREARAHLGGNKPALAIAFASPTLADLAAVPAVLADELGGVDVIGGTAGGCIIGPSGISSHGVSVVVLGGEGLDVKLVCTRIQSPELVEIVPAAEALTRAADEAARRGFPEFTCLVFAPALGVDGEAVVAAVRKGTGPRAQLAGALTGDDNTFDRSRVFADRRVSPDHVVLAGLFTTQPLGIAARHGYRPVGRLRTVTRSDGRWLVELDGRPAFDVWVDDARAAGAEVPSGRGKDVALYLANHFELGVMDGAAIEPVVRAPFAIRNDGAVQLSAGIGERARTRVMRATRSDLLEASREAARVAAGSAGGSLAGALVLSCSGRVAALGDDFADESASIARYLDAPVGGACVFGEIARGGREVDAFHNTTTVVVAIPH
jgi:hypothetical protein